MKTEVICGNIVEQPDADAIVNSANANLCFGSGVAVGFQAKAVVVRADASHRGNYSKIIREHSDDFV